MLETRICRHFPSLAGPKEYNDLLEFWKQINDKNLTEDFIRKLHDVVVERSWDEAMKFASLNRTVFACTDIDRRIVYVYRNNIWQFDHGNRYLEIAIVNFNKKYGKSRQNRQSFLADVCSHMYIEDFVDNLSNYAAIPMNDQCFDYVSGEMRTGCPTDYMSINLGAKPQTLYRDELVKILRDIFPDNDVYDYFMRFCGSLLVPGNREKVFMVWSGSGDNGKSIVTRLLELTLGNYAVKLPTSLITGKRTASAGATPELMQLDKKLVGFIQEPSNTDTINIGTMKELTGNDTIYCRGLYETPRIIHVKAKLIYVVNSTENLAALENATWNRIVIIPFVTHFTKDPKLPRDKPCDSQLANRLRDLSGDFLSLMISEAKEYIKHGQLCSKTIENATNETRIANDHIQMFLNNKNISHTYSSFKMFMEEYHSGIPVPTPAAFSKRLLQ